jgi:hypothetical protein
MAIQIRVEITKNDEAFLEADIRDTENEFFGMYVKFGDTLNTKVYEKTAILANYSAGYNIPVMDAAKAHTFLDKKNVTTLPFEYFAEKRTISLRFKLENPVSSVTSEEEVPGGFDAVLAETVENSSYEPISVN